MSRRTWLMCLALALSIAAAVSGTLAYLTDTETTTNVMAVGNVDIELTEWERGNQAGKETLDTLAGMELNAFKNGDKPLYPAVLMTDSVAEAKGTMWSSDEVVGVVDKIVQVKNVGASNAYFRTIVAFEAFDGMDELLHINWNETDYAWSEGTEAFLDDGNRYMVYYGVYQDVLAAGETAPMSLLQVYLDPEADNSAVAQLGSEYEIKVAAQAVQTNNFDAVFSSAMENGQDGYAAVLDKAFASHPWGDDSDGQPLWVSSAAELLEALDAAEDGDVIGLMGGEYAFSKPIEVKKAVTLTGIRDQKANLVNAVFDVHSTGNDHDMDVTFENLSFEGASRIKVGFKNHQSAAYETKLTKLTVRNCEADVRIETSEDYTDKGQFIYLNATYDTMLDLTLEGNTIVNAHAIANEDASPIINGNGTKIKRAMITGNTFGSAENPCDRYAVKFARRVADAEITIENNTVYGATTAEKDFYLFDLWQSGSNVRDGLDVVINSNEVIGQPHEGRKMYVAYIEASVKGDDLAVFAEGNAIDSKDDNSVLIGEGSGAVVVRAVDTKDDFLDAIDNAEDGDVIALRSGEYSFDSEIAVTKAVRIIGLGGTKPKLNNAVFAMDSSYAAHPMAVTYENLSFAGASRIKVGTKNRENGVGENTLTKLTVRNCEANVAIKENIDAEKGQFIYLGATYATTLDLTLEGNTFVNAHAIAGEDAAPVVNGNGTQIKRAMIRNNTFGSAANPCDRYAVKFARRVANAEITIENNTVYGATTAEKDFYLLDLWQSGSNVYDGLNVTLSGNTIHCRPDSGRAVYAAYIEASVTGNNITVTASGNSTDAVLNKAKQ